MEVDIVKAEIIKILGTIILRRNEENPTVQSESPEVYALKKIIREIDNSTTVEDMHRIISNAEKAKSLRFAGNAAETADRQDKFSAPEWDTSSIDALRERVRILFKQPPEIATQNSPATAEEASWRASSDDKSWFGFALSLS
jgi:hypothetical protein